MLVDENAHKITAKFWGLIHFWLGIPNTVLAAISGVSALSENKGLAATLALLVASVTAISTFIEPAKRAKAHLETGNRLTALINRIDLFMDVNFIPKTDPGQELLFKSINTIVKQDRSESSTIPYKYQQVIEVQTEFKSIVTEINDLKINSPLKPNWAIKQAKENLGLLDNNNPDKDMSLVLKIKNNIQGILDIFKNTPKQEA